MNFRDPNKAITNFPSILVRRNVQHPCSKIIEFSIPLPRRIESINMPANELSIKPADHRFLHQPKHNQPVHPSYRVTWRAHTYTHTGPRDRTAVIHRYRLGEEGVETSPGKQTADERGEPRNIPVMRHGVKERACWPH